MNPAIDPISRFVMDHLIEVTSQLIMPMMLLGFVLGISMRIVLFYIARSQSRFAVEFGKRVQRYFASAEAQRTESFQRLTRILMLKTFTDLFETKNKYKRRSFDHISSISERILMVEDGIKRLIDDTLRQIRFFKRSQHEPKMLEASKNIFGNNPYFTRVAGIFSVELLNDLLGILPSLFIIGGIFGTFLGIAKSLPDLGGMDLGNMEATKQIMDAFLVKISQSMIKSIIGIAFSVITSVVNTIFSVDNHLYTAVNRYAEVLENVWNETTTNDAEQLPAFPEENKTPDARAA